ncbi:hypothetical protein Sango_0255500 [Sesamum angolense]|uniref:Transposase n=1 Tax=Sesamum angolense TaxID=2727404 RepID=A0AAE1XH32_9LAMI|nr:hypothetical protein Sango_0255500 [Sesamum angolense]
MLFSSKKELRNPIHSHAVKTRRNIKITKNDKRRLYARCVEEGCDWKLHALVIGDKSTFQIRDYNDKHDCGANYHVKNCNSAWIGKKYEEMFRTDPKRSVKGFRHDVIKDVRCHISKSQAYRAKWNALKKIEGLSVDQYGMLWDYVEELRRSNPGSTFILSRAASDGSGIKGLTQNDSFPIAYAVVGGETRETWEWFLTLLRNDLNIHRDSDYTFMSDKQKGLIPAFETVFPTAENRFCVRHLHANMKKVGFKGLSYKKALWKAARATTVTEFEARRKEICKLDIKMGIPCKHAMSALSSQILDGEDFVDCCYHVQTYLRVYDPCIYPVNGPEKWNKTNIKPLLPPNPGRQVGRPARARRLEARKRTLTGSKSTHSTHSIKNTANKKAKCNTQGVRTRHQIQQQQQQQQAFKPPRKAPNAPGATATPSVAAPGASPTPSSSRNPSPTPRPGVTFAHVPFAPDHSQGLLNKAKEKNIPAPPGQIHKMARNL